MTQTQIKRPVVRIDTCPQMALFEGGSAANPGPAVASVQGSKPVRFVEQDLRDLRVGARRLDEHLREMGVRDALLVREMLWALDWRVFEARYVDNGRPAYSPRAMCAIVLFGLRRGVSSLRELERFARTDLGCMWVCGGITPDHSVLGRFIQRHEEDLRQELFTAVTDEALRRTGSDKERLAGDGTTLEAMSSRFALMKREAAQQWRDRLREAGRGEDDAERQQAETACEVLQGRENAKAIVPAEAQAGLLKLKNGRGSRPAYEAVVLANDQRVVVDAEVHSTSEIASMKRLIGDIDPRHTEELLLDAGFSNDFGLLELTLEKEISLLSPEGAEGAREGEAKRIPLREFRYDEEADCYVCPEGQRLMPARRHGGNAATGQRPYTQYAGSESLCGVCVRRAQCTRGVRTIQRTQGQEIKEALRAVMAQPKVKRIFAYRKAMVEPVFADLRERQGLNRFRRRGLAGVRLELRLHLMAYNISRVVAYARRRAARGVLGAILRLWRLVRGRGRGITPFWHLTGHAGSRPGNGAGHRLICAQGA